MSVPYILSPQLEPTSDPVELRDAALARLESILATDWLWGFETNDIVIPRQIVRGADALIQRVKLCLRFFLGEWFLDQRLGVPWIQQIFVAGPDMPKIQAILSRAIMKVPGVRGISGAVLTRDKATRRIRFERFTIIATDGTTILVEEPFIV